MVAPPRLLVLERHMVLVEEVLVETLGHMPPVVPVKGVQ
jgi:hypothetical protein